MAKNKRGKKRNWRRFRFSADNLQRHVQDDLQDSAHKQEQKEYQEKIRRIELDILSRTIFVSSVKDLKRHPNNRVALKAFLERSYGPVESCTISSYSKKKGRSQRSLPPPARVVFQYAQHAEAIFDGKPLMQARRDSAMVRVPCPSVGYRGMLQIRPSDKFPNMLQSNTAESNELKIPVERIAFGHWSPVEEDAYLRIPGNFEAPRLHDEAENEWLEEVSTTLSPILRIDFQKRLVELDFGHRTGAPSSLGEDSPNPESRLLLAFARMLNTPLQESASFRFKNLASYMEICTSGEDRYDLIFSLKHPPKIYSKTALANGQTRRTDCSGIGKETFGQCLSYRLSIQRTKLDQIMIFERKVLEKLQKFGVVRSEFDSLQQAIPFSVLRVPASGRSALQRRFGQMYSFRLGLMLRNSLDNNKFAWYHLLHDLVGRSNLFDLVNCGNLEVTTMILNQMCDMHGQTRYPARLFDHLYRDELEAGEPINRFTNTPAFCIELPRLLITPCREAVTGFEVEVSNRVARHFIRDAGFSPESFTRVTIADENGDKLFSDDLNGPVADRIRTMLLNGLQMNGRHYKFLAYSSSQLKELSVWMVYPEGHWTVSAMREWMGDFSNCHTASKYAARTGQCFSTTIETLQTVTGTDNEATLRVNDRLPDIISYDGSSNEMCHSDGTGIIRRDRMDELVRRVPFGAKNPRDVSIVQVRFGGAKGTLTAWEDETKLSALRDADVCLRPSMVKFQAGYRHLEVIGIGSHIPYYLNRNVVFLLSHHGVPGNIFLEMQNEMFQDLNKMLYDRRKAMQMVPRLGGLSSDLTSTMMHMLSCGILPSEDPFLFSCLHALRTHHLMEARKKARIYVEKGAVLMGGIDELGLVPEGCVFVQVRKSCSSPEKNPYHKTNDGFEPLTGPVMVTKHPVMHPGDVRMLKAVDIPDLRCHRNVILFSRHGARPEADKMSGSDLDGDQFAVTWDSRLFLRTENAAPMDFTPPPGTNEATTIDDQALVNHFINHARADNLGRIASLWLDYAAINSSPACAECIRLAELHSIAVDFPKSGVPAKIDNNLILKKSIARPHWKERKDAESFHCESIVGQLYDQVIEQIGRRTLRGVKAVAGRHCDKNGQLLIYLPDSGRGLMEKLRELYDPRIPLLLGWYHNNGTSLQIFANNERRDYEEQLLKLMNKYRAKAEGEIMTGCIRKYHKLHKRRRHDVSEDIRRQCREIRSAFRENFFRKVFMLAETATLNMGAGSGDIQGGGDHSTASVELTDDYSDDEEDFDFDIDDEVLRHIEFVATTAKALLGPKDSITRQHSFKLAAAYYMSAYSPDFRTEYDGFALFSFPWLVADVLATGIHNAK